MIKNYLLFPLFPKNILSGNKQKVYKKSDRVLNVIFKKGWTTRVEKGKACMSACAFAFLGGRFFGASRG